MPASRRSIGVPRRTRDSLASRSSIQRQRAAYRGDDLLLTELPSLLGAALEEIA
jgi:hypothetical protein